MMKDYGTTSTASTTPSVDLSVQDIIDILDTLPKAPVMPKYDIYGSEYVDQLLELPENVHPYNYNTFGVNNRKVLIAPKNKLLYWYHELRNLGIDIRLEPRINQPSPNPLSDK